MFNDILVLKSKETLFNAKLYPKYGGPEVRYDQWCPRNTTIINRVTYTPNI